MSACNFPGLNSEKLLAPPRLAGTDFGQAGFFLCQEHRLQLEGSSPHHH